MMSGALFEIADYLIDDCYTHQQFAKLPEDA